LKDLTKREWTLFVPIVIFIVWIGVYPSSFLNLSENSTRKLVNKIEKIKFGKTVYPELNSNSNESKMNDLNINSNKTGK
jgi:NADH-quinone oxidoreductase subunit M